MKNLWNIADLIDLHYFFQTDEKLRLLKGEGALAKRDRIIYVAKIEPQMGKVDDIPPRLLVRKWLGIRRMQFLQEKGSGELILPGTVWQELALICRWLFFLCGIFIGAGLAGSFLIYSGVAPLNVSVYIGLFVLLQLLFLGLQMLFFVYRSVRRIPMESSMFYAMIGRMLIKGADGLRRKLQRKMTGRQRLDLAALMGGVQQRKELAALLIWPAFLLVQLGGIGFNLGVLGVTLAKVVFSDIAFGWQSSLQLSAGAVAHLVQWIALPWSWVVPHAYPNLEQIQGSQMVLKEGIAHLTTGDLVSWWPFLCCAVAVYGLLPRLALFALGMVQLQRALDQLHFATLGIQPLVQRMTAPRIDTSGVVEVKRTELFDPLPGRSSGPASVAVPQGILSAVGNGLWIVLIPDELYEDCPQVVLADLLSQQTDTPRIECIRYGLSGHSENENLALLTGSVGEKELSGVLLLQEAWQPPLRETESFLQQMRRVVGDTVQLTILLIGKPSAATIFTPVDQVQLQVWVQKMRAIGDSSLDVMPLVHS